MEKRFNQLKKDIEKERSDNTDFEDEKKRIINKYDNQLIEEEQAITEIKSSITQKEKVKRDKGNWEKTYQQWEYLNERLDEELKQVRWQNMIDMQRKNDIIVKDHELKLKESEAKAKLEADQEIKAIEKEIHRKNTELNNDAIGQRYQIDKIKSENDKL